MISFCLGCSDLTSQLLKICHCNTVVIVAVIFEEPYYTYGVDLVSEPHIEMLNYFPLTNVPTLTLNLYKFSKKL